MNADWSEIEVNAIVNDYFHMLLSELNGRPYNKAAHRKTLIPLLNNRSDGSIEFKHQNISAALINMGCPYIKGYKPRYNYQRDLLESAIATFIDQHREQLESALEKFVDAPLNSNEILSPNAMVEEEYIPSSGRESEPIFRPLKINYLEREQQNKTLGNGGELLIFEHEKNYLLRNGKPELAQTVEWTAQEKGDGMGYDILSKNLDGTNRYIEVKTTKLGKETPIFFSRNELLFSQMHDKNFYLYRVFDFGSKPSFYVKNGSLDRICTTVSPITFKGQL